METRLKIKGHLNLRVVRADGTIEEFDFKNLVVTYGLNLMAKYLSGGTVSTPVNHIAVGTGTTPPSSTNTALGVEVSRKQASVAQGVGADAHKVTFQATWAAGQLNNSFTEAGLFDAATAGNMFSRVTFAAVPVSSADTLIATWVISFTGV